MFIINEKLHTFCVISENIIYRETGFQKESLWLIVAIVGTVLWNIPSSSYELLFGPSLESRGWGVTLCICRDIVGRSWVLFLVGNQEKFFLQNPSSSPQQAVRRFEAIEHRTSLVNVFYLSCRLCRQQSSWMKNIVERRRYVVCLSTSLEYFYVISLPDFLKYRVTFICMC